MHNLHLQNLESTLENLGVIPLYGSPPPFSLIEFGQALSSAFHVFPIEIQIKKTDFQKKPLEGMGASPFIRPFVLSPLPEEFFLVFPKGEIAKLVKSLLFQEGSQRSLSDENLALSFVEVSLLAACQNFNNLNPFENLSASFADECPLPEDGALRHEISIQLGEEVVTSCLICSMGSLRGFRSFYEMKRHPFTIEEDNAQLPIPLSYEVGETTIRATEWQKAHLGDCLLLDRCTINLESGKGTAILASSATPLFDVRIKGAEAKILNYAMTQKEKAMTNELPPLPEDMQEPKAQPLPADQIPLTVTVEVDRFRMPLEKVAQLKPGNVLEIRKSDGAGVYLTISGKRVATGELVRLGEAMGVKILRLGD
jgi:flagellar motor switch protein FliN/FliY